MEHSLRNRIGEMVGHLGVPHTIAWSLIALFGLGNIGICAYGISSTIQVEPHIVSPREASASSEQSQRAELKEAVVIGIQDHEIGLGGMCDKLYGTTFLYESSPEGHEPPRSSLGTSP